MPANMWKNARDVVEYESGQVVFEEGDAGDVMYAVVDGGIFGELALIDASARGATAVASRDSRLARLDESHFMFMVQEHPTFALQVMRVMAERLRRANRS